VSKQETEKGNKMKRDIKVGDIAIYETFSKSTYVDPDGGSYVELPCKVLRIFKARRRDFKKATVVLLVDAGKYKQGSQWYVGLYDLKIDFPGSDAVNSAA
jgi:hypothetical protein